MITEALQGVAVFAAVVGPLGYAVNKWMVSEAKVLPGGFQASTGEWDRWGQAMRKPAARKGARS